jgi:hypothetical protein
MAVVLGLLLTAVIAMSFGWLFTVWFGFDGARQEMALTVFAGATLTVIILFLAGQLLGLRSHAYYLICAGAVFFGVDVLNWMAFDIMPGPKFFQDGFVPASIMGLFLGPLYRVVAVPLAQMPRDPLP